MENSQQLSPIMRLVSTSPNGKLKICKKWSYSPVTVLHCCNIPEERNVFCVKHVMSACRRYIRGMDAMEDTKEVSGKRLQKRLGTKNDRDSFTKTNEGVKEKMRSGIT